MQGTSNSQNDIEKEQSCWMCTIDLRTYHKAIVTKTVSQWLKNRYTDQWTGKDSREINPYIISQLVFNKHASSNSAGKE